MHAFDLVRFSVATLVLGALAALLVVTHLRAPAPTIVIVHTWQRPAFCAGWDARFSSIDLRPSCGD